MVWETAGIAAPLREAGIHLQGTKGQTGIGEILPYKPGHSGNTGGMAGVNADMLHIVAVFKHEDQNILQRLGRAQR